MAILVCYFFFFKQKTAYEMRISDWSSDVCSSDLADYALSSDFHTGFRRLLELSQRKTCAIMCSEAVWWRCHRRIVADYLLDTGRPVFHLMAHDRIEPAKMTSSAMRQDDHLLYPRSEAHTSELQSLMRISYAVFCLT